MLHLFAKFLSLFTIPTNLAIFAAIGATVAMRKGERRLSARLWLGALLTLALFGFSPLTTAITFPLEQRFPPPPAGLPAPRGIIVLSGGIERVIGAAVLARRYPNARVIYSGGPNDPDTNENLDAEQAFDLMTKLGIPASRITIDVRARSTYENAIFTRDIVKPMPQEHWILVTSAIHVPRAVGVFRRQGFTVVAYPIAYKTSGHVSDFWQFRSDAGGGLALGDAALHEWAGLIVYRMLGETDELFPAPKP